MSLPLKLARTSGRNQFSLVGLVSSKEFQICQTYIEVLHSKYPHHYDKPFIRPMLEYDWQEYLLNMQRECGGSFWKIQKKLAVFVNNLFLGDDEDLLTFLSEKLQVQISRDYDCLSKSGLLEVYRKYMEIGRKFIFFSVSLDNHVIGNLIFMLYADFLPKTCKRFLRKCNSRHRGYKGTEIHRIMESSWIQFGGFTLPPDSHSCEHYKIAHNRRGILSMCNDGRHIHNTTQFFVCLNPTPWMDYKYVAFGQLVQGDHVLQTLEKIPTYYEAPYGKILKIADAGEIILDDVPKERHTKAIEAYIATRDARHIKTIRDPRDSASIVMETHYLAGDYFAPDDQTSRLPMDNLPEQFYPQALESYGIESSVEEEETVHTPYAMEEHEKLLKLIAYSNGFGEYEKPYQCSPPRMSFKSDLWVIEEPEGE